MTSVTIHSVVEITTANNMLDNGTVYDVMTINYTDYQGNEQELTVTCFAKNNHVGIQRRLVE